MRLLCILILYGSAPAFGQISPGPLSQAHAEFDGPTKCTSCHVFGAGERRFRCVDCHTEIRDRLKYGRGYHPAISNLNKRGLDCARCHAEHFGRDFHLVAKKDLSPAEFDHTKTGYTLTGKHTALECTKCHTRKNLPAAVINTLKVKDPQRTWLGLTAACLTCHPDEHKGQLSGDCAKCHTTQSWKLKERFDHETTRYPLTGLHQRVDCARCHPAGHYKGIAFGLCENCHKDPHKGGFREAKFEGGCNGCHVTGGWKLVKDANGFDHSRTKFPLGGKHGDVNCFKCHKTVDFNQPIAHEHCADCHKDIHDGQFALRKDGGECASCHTDKGWKPATFTRERHQQSAYKLEGKHSNVECAKCHEPRGPTTLYSVPFDACLRCHKDAHDGQFDGAPHNARCESCHSVNGFQPSSYSLDRHSRSRFLLTGSHAATACGECHKPPAGFVPARPVRYQFDDITCTGCHRNPHPSQAPAAECTGCHTTRDWKTTLPFDHSRTSFALQGSHRAVICLDCHKPVGTAKGARDIAFRGAATTCSGCHEDIHAAQFASQGKADCALCHLTSKWKATTFDHQTTSFPLDGQHKSIDCRLCHKERREVAGRVVIFYKEAQHTCRGCHSGIIQ